MDGAVIDVEAQLFVIFTLKSTELLKDETVPITLI